MKKKKEELLLEVDRAKPGHIATGGPLMLKYRIEGSKKGARSSAIRRKEATREPVVLNWKTKT